MNFGKFFMGFCVIASKNERERIFAWQSIKKFQSALYRLPRSCFTLARNDEQECKRSILRAQRTKQNPHSKFMDCHANFLQNLLAMTGDMAYRADTFAMTAQTQTLNIKQLFINFIQLFIKNSTHFILFTLVFARCKLIYFNTRRENETISF